jgi:ABC-2 type transport system permease protein
MKEAWFNLRIYFLLQSVHIRTSLMYEADFWIGVVGVILTQGAGFVFIWAIFQRIPQIEGWGLWEVALLYALVVIPRGLTELLCDGQWRLRLLVNRGEFDRLLVRPVSPLVQLLTQFYSIHGAGSVALGAIILGQSAAALGLKWGFAEWTLLVVTLANAVVLMGSINLMTNCIAFWEPSSSSSFPFMFQQLVDFSKFPLTLYSQFIQFVLTWIVPFAFVSYYPGMYLLGKPGSQWMAFATPLSGIGVALLAYGVWSWGLQRYQGTGS